MIAFFFSQLVFCQLLDNSWDEKKYEDKYNLHLQQTKKFSVSLKIIF